MNKKLFSLLLILYSLIFTACTSVDLSIESSFDEEIEEYSIEEIEKYVEAYGGPSEEDFYDVSTELNFLMLPALDDSKNLSIDMKELTAKDRSTILYYSLCNKGDKRIKKSKAEDGETYDYATKSDLEDIVNQMIGESSVDEMREFIDGYNIEEMSDGTVRMNLEEDYGIVPQTILKGKIEHGKNEKCIGDVNGNDYGDKYFDYCIF